MIFPPLLSGFRRPRATADRLRIALVGTPRSGNTWMRHMLDHLYRFSDRPGQELALYNPLEAPWSDLPERCVIMTHWHRTAPFTTLLEEHGFRVVTLARHPIDVLISVLQYASCGESLRWMEGEGGGERPIYDASPQSEAFRQYAVGIRARALLAVSVDWWKAPGCHSFRYEDLVRDPVRQITRLTRALGVAPSCRVEEAVDACRFERLRREESPKHFWKGRPGLWKTLLTAPEARRIASAHRASFSRLGYACDPDEALTEARAAENWARLGAPASDGEALRRSA